MRMLSGQRNLAIIMVVAMLFSMIPFGAFAAIGAKGADQIVTFAIGQSSYQKGGNNFSADVAPYIKDDRTMVPVAFVAPALGTDRAVWIPENQMVRITRGDDLIMIKIGSRELVVNGKIMMMDTAAEIKDIGGGGGRTMLPISFIARALGVGYQWNNQTRSVDFYGYSENFASAGTFGPATGSETIAGNVFVTAPGVRLQNKVIKGDLIIAESVGTGDVFLDNITVEGNTFVRGGGKNSIHINGGSYTNVIIEDTPDGGTRVVATNTDGINIVVATAQAGEQVILEGTFANVEVTAANANVTTQGQTTIQNITVNNRATVTVAAGTTVNTVTLNAAATVAGEGTVTNANVNVSGSTVATAGTTITSAEGVTPPSTTTETTPATTTPTGGGGGGGGGSDDSPSTTAVTAVSVSSTTLTLTAGGAAGTITATVLPADATNKTVTWTSSNQAVATVVAGVVTPLTAGTTTITATTVDGSFTATTLVTVEAAEAIDVTLQNIFAETDMILISIFKTEEIDPLDPTTREIPSLSADDFILIKDFGGAGSTQITGFTLEVDPLGGTWEYEIVPAVGDSFAPGSYRLGFSKAGYNPAHIDFDIVAAVDKTALTAAIAAANTNKASVTVSTDGTDIPTTDQWVTAAVMADYTTAIATAQGVADDGTADQATVDAAVTALATATTTFDGAKAAGTLADSTAADNADIATAKGNIEGATYTATQAEASDATDAATKAQALVDALDLAGTTAVVVPGTFTAATAGDAGTPAGTNGSYTFTVTIDKGLGTQAVSAEQTMTITATAYVPSDVATVTSGTYTVSAGGTAAETITNVPSGTAKADFLAALTEGQADQTWNDAGIDDPVVTGNTLVVTAQDGVTTVTYTVTVTE